MQSRCRQQKRKCGGHQNWETLNGRCGGGPARYVHSCSDAGTRSAAEQTSDGARSIRSGFSAASAPLNIGGGLEGVRARHIRLDSFRDFGGVGFGAQHLRGRSCGGNRGPQLPMIIDTRRRRRTSHGSSGHACSGKSHRVNTIYRSSQGASVFAGPAETCPESEVAVISSESGSRTPIPLSADKTEDDNHYREQLTIEREGYDGGAAATILRVARRRDPAGLNANFEQFWTWKRRPAATAFDIKRKKEKQPALNGTPQHFTNSSGCSRTVGGGGDTAVASKLETLARMKTVYTTKEDSNNGGGCAPARTTAASPRKHTSPYKLPPEPRPPDRAVHIMPTDDGSGIAHSATALGSRTFWDLSEDTTGVSDHTNVQSRGCTEGWIGSDDDDMTKPGADGTSQSNFDQKNEAVVNVPDLDLTESQIRLVDKYFGGSGGAGRHRRPTGEVGV